MITPNETLQEYTFKAEGITRSTLNIMCFIGAFIFGWLLTMVFERLGKKGLGWYYVIPVIVLFGISRQGPPIFSVLAPIVYIVGWIHANIILSEYQALARERIVTIEALVVPSGDSFIEKGVLYGKVLGNKQLAQQSFIEALGRIEGGNATMLNLAGNIMMANRDHALAAKLFERALTVVSTPGESEQIKTNHARALKKAAR